MYVANIVGTLRKERQLTQVELAEAVGVSRQTVIAIEKGNYTPSVTLALKIAAFFQTPVESIFTLHDAT
ncbi:helix-turn-helix transcriptional regulator [Candidatus Woesebacteria bacterium]|nr:helix-turn-helix transcriptional regulator [Candidatus Woesebacteria bacterium]MCD8526917.1 helix-turn-helix transcriptional regulator [Candidatus Woesebacteria bacterium]MCD8546066.1 helix-turn-helix transcriptional regulator [Candidatus Woesebacteria bacterium]